MAPKEADRLKKERAVARGQITKKVNQFKELIIQLNYDRALTALTQAESAYSKMNQMSEEYRSVADLSDKDLEADVEEDYKYSDEICEAKVQWEQLKKEDPKPHAPTDPVPPPRLDPLPVPEFNGDRAEFSNFWALFKQRIDKDTRLQDADKLAHLLSKVKGPALEAIEHFPVTAAGYERAKTLLLNRFGKKITLINDCMSRVLMTTMPTSSDSVSIRSLSDNLNLHVRTLEALGVSTDQCAPVLSPILLSKIPMSLKSRFYEQHGDGVNITIDTAGYTPPTVDAILNFLSVQAENAELSEPLIFATSETHRQKWPTKTKPRYRKQGSVTAMGVQTEETQGDQRVQRAFHCVLCSAEGHPVRKCPRYLEMTPECRQQTVQKHGLCFNCLSDKHRKQQCQSSTNCLRCSKRHHTTLCRSSNSTNNKVYKTSGQGDSTQSFGKKTPDTHNKSDTSTESLHVQSDGIINVQGQSNSSKVTTQGFFPTVRANLLVTKGSVQKKYPVRLLLDSCSSSTFVEQSVAIKHGLQPMSMVPLTMSFFTKGSVDKTVPQYNLTLEAFDGTHKMNVVAYGMNVCRPLTNSKINPKELPHLRPLKFSDNPCQEGGKEVDLLIGYDYYHDIVTGQISKGSKNQPVAIETVFGWALHGGVKQHSPDAQGLVSAVHHVQISRDDTVEPTLQECVAKMTDWSYHSTHDPEVEKNWITPSIEHGRFQVPLPWVNRERPTSNRNNVLQYQRGVFNRLNHKKQREYDTYIEDYLRLFIVEKCDPITSGKAWYLPHHGLWRKNKLRVVFDGSYGNPSINERLLTGPNMLQRIPTCLTSFRLHSVPVAADVEKAFLQVAIQPEDRDYLRFVAFQDGKEVDLRFTRMPFGLNSSPALLNTCLKQLYDRMQEQYPETTNVLRKAVYCDDLVTSVADTMEFEKLKEESCAVFREAGMNLRGWTQQPTEVLGVQFRHEEDCLEIPLAMKTLKHPEAALTRRHIVSEAARVYDPLGWAAPWTVRVKWLIQSTWQPNVNWDTPLSEQHIQEWSKLCEESREEILSIPRCVGFTSNAVLHVFSDASMKAYASCAYLTSANTSRLLISRNRIVSTKAKTTIPRLELQAAVLGALMCEEVLQAFTHPSEMKIYVWVDSTCVLQWRSGSVAKLPTYVANRVSRLQEFTSAYGVEWHHCGSKENPADLATRGITPQALQRSALWLHGPVWLSHPEDWPLAPDATAEVNTALATEARPLTTDADDTMEGFAETYLKKFCKFSVAIGATALVRRVIHNHEFAKKFLLCNVHLSSLEHPITFCERDQAKQALIKWVQREHLTQLREALDKHPDTLPNNFKSVRPHIDINTGMIMATPRTAEPPLILMPRHSHLCTLLILDTHHKLFHAATPRVMTEIQRQYWVPKLRSKCKQILRSCVHCQRYQSRPYVSPEGALAPFRSTAAPPFAHTGLDFAEHIQIAPGKKAFILLFTCAVSRALHLELCSNMKTETLFAAVTRFMGRRGTPISFYSDNAKSFTKLSSMVNSRWIFIPARSPWWGGWWERLVGTVKSALRKTLHLCALDKDELITVLADLEGVLNRRPITYVSDDPESVFPITPAHFLHVPLVVGEPWMTVTGSGLTSKWRHWRRRADALLGRWKREYLSEIRSWRKPPVSDERRRPNIGDIVLLREGPKRALWPLGKITKVISDQLAEVQVKGRLTTRPIRSLFPFETQPPWSPLPHLIAPTSAPPPVSSSTVEQQQDEDDRGMPTTRLTRRGRQVRLPARYQD